MGAGEGKGGEEGPVLLDGSGFRFPQCIEYRICKFELESAIDGGICCEVVLREGFLGCVKFPAKAIH